MSFVAILCSASFRYIDVAAVLLKLPISSQTDPTQHPRTGLTFIHHITDLTSPCPALSVYPVPLSISTDLPRCKLLSFHYVAVSQR